MKEKSKFVNMLTVLKDHLMLGISYMMPVIIGGAILYGIAMAVGTTDVMNDPMSHGRLIYLLYMTGQAGMSLYIPVFGAYVAFSIADRPSIAPGLVGAYIANSTGCGFVGALIAGFVSGWLVNQLKKVKFPASMSALKTLLFIPILSILAMGVLFYGIIGVPLAGAVELLQNWLTSMTGANAILLGVIIGGMIGFDYGGPVNKVAYATSVALLADGITTVMAASAAAMTIPGIGMWLATKIAPKKFTEGEKGFGNVAAIMGLCTISEGAIPFAASDPIRVMISTTVGGAVAGAIAMAAKVEVLAPLGGVFILPVIKNVPMYLASIAIGTVVIALIAVALKKEAVEPAGATEEADDDEEVLIL